MRRLRFGLAATTLASLVLTSAAGAVTLTAHGGALTAALSYTGSGSATRNEKLMIESAGQTVYSSAVPTTGCAKVCSPEGKQPLQVADLYGDGSQEVVLTQFNGGADCCTIADVYVHSSALNSYVVDEHNFGEAGAKIEPIGPHRRPLFVSGNGAFYCRFSYCYSSVLPLQILEFQGERFIDVTRQFPKLIAAEAAKLINLYYADPKQGQGIIPAWAADEDSLGKTYQATVDTVLERQYADHNLSLSFVKSLEHFLIQQHYA